MYPLDDNATGVIIARELLHQHLPEAQVLENKIENGRHLNDFDLQHLQEQLDYCHEVLPYLKYQPQLEKISCTLISMYHRIAEKALDDALAQHKDHSASISEKVIRGEMLVVDID